MSASALSTEPVVGLIGTAADFVLLEHYEELGQLVPLLLIGLALAGLVWGGTRGTTTSRRAVQTLMIAFMVAGLAGMVLHFRVTAAFQREINPRHRRLGSGHKGDDGKGAARARGGRDGAVRPARAHLHAGRFRE